MIGPALRSLDALAICLIGSGCLVWLLTLMAAIVFRLRARPKPAAPADWPAVTLLKPICGLEKQLGENLRSACRQDYPDYQVLFSLQRPDDPALPLLLEVASEFGRDRVSVAVEQVTDGLNGKINNLVGALRHARHEWLVISDSDVYLRPDYLKVVMASLTRPGVSAVSTFFRAIDAKTWYERMEQLTINADHFAIALLAHVLGLTDFCFGASIGLSRTTLRRIGGFAALGDYLVEDHELGRRIRAAGMRLRTLDYVVDTRVDLASARQWWQKQTYWDQNTRSAEPWLFAFTLLLRVIPLALALCVVRGFDPLSLLILAGACLVRLGCAIVVLGFVLSDRVGLGSVWLIPIKDVLSLYWFVFAFLKRTVVWRGKEMRLTRSGRLEPLGSEPEP